ncbi:hypothetical protein AMATHDRAFT_103848, partial [Amanita thiersii Skay4041]
PPTFDSNAAADVILRSSDSVDFFVIELLCHVSHVFQDMISLNRGEAAQHNQMKDQLPIAPIPEDSETLRNLLLLIYPYVDDPMISNAALYLKLGRMAQKYCMDVVDVKLQKLLFASPLVTQDPFRIYVIAVQLKWDQVSRLAASNTL